VSRVEPFAFEDAPEELAMAESGNHLVLFEATDPAHQIAPGHCPFLKPWH